MISLAYRVCVDELGNPDGSGWAMLNSVTICAGDRIVLDVDRTHRVDQKIATTLASWLPTAHIEIVGHPVAVDAWAVALSHPEWPA